MIPTSLRQGGGSWFGATARRLAPSSDDDCVLVANKKFTVKLQSHRREAAKAQRLRYDVFHREFRGRRFPFGFDRDPYDSGADHILVVETGSGKVVGSYRAITSDDTARFYSASEFDLGTFAKSPEKKLELSRACIHRQYRKGAVLALLWRGISVYMQRQGVRYVFGIPSLKTTDPRVAAEVYLALKANGQLGEAFSPQPTGEFVLDGFWDAVAKLSKSPESARPQIPPLFQVYLKAGAKVVGTPAVDRAFQCVDFFTILDLENMAAAFQRKYTS